MTQPPTTPFAGGKPLHAAPANACDAHIHIYDARFAHIGLPDAIEAYADVTAYRNQQARIGTTRAVVVTPRPYGTDNRVTLDAIEHLGSTRTRGIAVLTPDVSDKELEKLNNGGIRGIRFTLYTPENAVTGFEMVERLSQRVRELGWHVQLHWNAEQIVDHAALLARLPSSIVFDHLARLPLPAGTKHPAYRVVRKLLDNGKTWVKLSGPYLDSHVGEQGAYADSDAVAREWVRVAPDRLVWGSDWPHVTESVKPDAALLFDLLSRWVDDDAARHRILVENPALLYGFPV
jgi:predicted TIM-barrel fold metal-dependent hydrolase